MDAVRGSIGVARASRSSSFMSQGSNLVQRRETVSVANPSSGTNPPVLLKKESSGSGSKWELTLQAAAAALSGRGTEPADREAGKLASAVAGLRDGKTLYFGKDISTSMWWRFRRGADDEAGGEGQDARRPNAADDPAGAPPYENTYRTEPRPGGRFRPEQVEAAMAEILERELHGKEYEAESANRLVKRLADEIKDRVKRLGFDRYRLVVLTQVGSIDGLEMMVVNRCVWNADTDCLGTVTYQNGWIYAIATTYGVYMD